MLVTAIVVVVVAGGIFYTGKKYGQSVEQKLLAKATADVQAVRVAVTERYYALKASAYAHIIKLEGAANVIEAKAATEVKLLAAELRDKL